MNVEVASFRDDAWEGGASSFDVDRAQAARSRAPVVSGRPSTSASSSSAAAPAAAARPTAAGAGARPRSSLSPVRVVPS
eukprot:6453631-Pyramimonas_sp.AAC.1